jgi:hypothetical protein
MGVSGKTLLTIITRHKQEEQFYGDKIELGLSKAIEAKWCPSPSKTYRLTRLINW